MIANTLVIVCTIWNAPISNCFPQTCPDEWEKAIGTKSSPQVLHPPSLAPLPWLFDMLHNSLLQVDAGSDDPKMEVIEGVTLEDQAASGALDGEGGDSNPLAAAAAAYAKMRTAVGTTNPTSSGLDLTEAEVAMVTVLATFLTVHPLGATVSEMTQYFQTFNPVCNSYYLESLLHRLPKVFQLSQSSAGEAKWWFLGFQTCCSQAQHSQLHYTGSDTVGSAAADVPAAVTNT